MSVFDKFPKSTLRDLNLDWIISTIKKIVEELPKKMESPSNQPAVGDVLSVARVSPLGNYVTKWIAQDIPSLSLLWSNPTYNNIPANTRITLEGFRAFDFMLVEYRPYPSYNANNYQILPTYTNSKLDSIYYQGISTRDVRIDGEAIIFGNQTTYTFVNHVLRDDSPGSNLICPVAVYGVKITKEAI